MIRKGVVMDVESVLDLIRGEDSKAVILGERVKVSGVRLSTFAEKGITCVFCDTEASFFAVEKSTENDGYHLNLYGLNQHGHELLFTRDHIMPKSLGGPDTLENMQPACEKCNVKKGNNPDWGKRLCQ